jgi:hypothetical protein
MTRATCMNCGSLFAPAYDDVFCGRCVLETASLVPHDVTRDAWGRRVGSSDMACYVDGNCLRLSIATALQVAPERVPDPTSDFRHDDWLERYCERLKRALRIRLEAISPGACPPIGRVSWIAVFRRETNDHAVLARGPHVLHDPQSKRLNGLDVRCEEIAYGLRILAANAPVTDSWGRQVA